MLVLTIEVGESVRIGNSYIIRNRNNRFGFIVTPETEVKREEADNHRHPRPQGCKHRPVPASVKAQHETAYDAATDRVMGELSQ